jgi:single-strand DNA-binding protein
MTTTITGNITRDPELRFTTGSRATVSFGVAVTRKWKGTDGDQEQTSFFNVVAWGTLAENVAASCTKGMRVVVTGRLEQREYVTKEGDKRSVVEIVADEVGPSLRWAKCEVERVERDGGMSQLAPRRQPEAEAEEPF